MKKITFQLLTILLGFTLIITSCAKDGAPGPAGQNGLNGQDGKDGTNGTNGINGANGEDGNANVQVLLWNTPPVPVGGIFTFTHSAITEDIVNEGAVLYYFTYGGYWWTTPYIDGTFKIIPNVKTGELRVHTEGSATSTISSGKSRVVLIGGSGSGVTVVSRPGKPWHSLTEIEKAKQLYPEVDFSNYESVKAAFNLED